MAQDVLQYAVQLILHYQIQPPVFSSCSGPQIVAASSFSALLPDKADELYWSVC